MMPQRFFRLIMDKRIEKRAATFASEATPNKIGLHYLRVWLQGKYERTLQTRGPFFPGHGKQGFFFGGSTPFLFAPSKRNGVEKAPFEIKILLKRKNYVSMKQERLLFKLKNLFSRGTTQYYRRLR